MPKVLHVIQGFTKGGAARAMQGIIKYSSKSNTHEVLSLHSAKDCGQSSPESLKIPVHWAPSREDRSALIASADVVHVHWWNNPDLDALLHESLPASRMIGWFHVGGHRAPQLLTNDLLEYFDYSVACSPYTYKAKAFQNLSADYRSENTSMIYGAADFAAVSDVKHVPHDTFNVGYVGTVDFVKMHPDYVNLSAQINIPNVRFVVAGMGGAVNVIKQQSAKLGKSENFQLLGYQDNIASVFSSLDVYGYPLCEDTYAASELNLQEAMYCGIPPVVFPHGGIQDLIVHNFTGLIVHTAREYKEAIEYLYNNPDERKRIGENARNYASQIFGAEHAAKQFDSVYDKILTREKKQHKYGTPKTSLNSERKLEVSDIFSRGDDSGAVKFISSLGAEGLSFINLLHEEEFPLAYARNLLNGLTEQSRTALFWYADFYPMDTTLALWGGVIEESISVEAAIRRWLAPVIKGHNDKKLLNCIVRCAEEYGLADLARDIKQVIQHV